MFRPDMYQIVTGCRNEWVISQPAYACKVVWLTPEAAEQWRALVKKSVYGRTLPILLMLATLIIVMVVAIVVSSLNNAIYAVVAVGAVNLVVAWFMGLHDKAALKRIDPQLRALLPEMYANIRVSNINAWPGPGERAKATHVIMPRA